MVRREHGYRVHFVKVLPVKIGEAFPAERPCVKTFPVWCPAHEKLVWPCFPASPRFKLASQCLPVPDECCLTSLDDGRMLKTLPHRQRLPCLLDFNVTFGYSPRLGFGPFPV